MNILIVAGSNKISINRRVVVCHDATSCGQTDGDAQAIASLLVARHKVTLLTSSHQVPDKVHGQSWSTHEGLTNALTRELLSNYYDVCIYAANTIDYEIPETIPMGKMDGRDLSITLNPLPDPASAIKTTGFPGKVVLIDYNLSQQSDSLSQAYYRGQRIGADFIFSIKNVYAIGVVAEWNMTSGWQFFPRYNFPANIQRIVSWNIRNVLPFRRTTG